MLLKYEPIFSGHRITICLLFIAPQQLWKFQTVWKSFITLSHFTVVVGSLKFILWQLQNYAFVLDPKS